jgi:hypothetical protein
VTILVGESGTANDALDARDELKRVEWLDDEVIGSNPERFELVLYVSPGTCEDYWPEVPIGAKLLTELETTRTVEVNVDDRKVRLLPLHSSWFFGLVD